jgi:hypothetical protein
VIFDTKIARAGERYPTKMWDMAHRGVQIDLSSPENPSKTDIFVGDKGVGQSLTFLLTMV